MGCFCSILPVFFGYLHRQASYGSYESSNGGLSTSLAYESDEEADYEPRIRRRQSLWQKGINRVQPYSMARTRQHHQGLGRDGATRGIDRYRYESEYSLDYGDETKARGNGRQRDPSARDYY